MIDPKELRIGNFIFDDDGIVSKVIGFKPYDHSVRCDEKEGCDISVDLYPQDGRVREAMLVESTLASPIKLSPEWMEKMGFEKRKDKKSIWELGRLTVWLGVGCLCYLREEDSQFSHYIPNGGIRHV